MKWKWNEMKWKCLHFQMQNDLNGIQNTIWQLLPNKVIWTQETNVYKSHSSSHFRSPEWNFSDVHSVLYLWDQYWKNLTTVKLLNNWPLINETITGDTNHHFDQL